MYVLRSRSEPGFSRVRAHGRTSGRALPALGWAPTTHTAALPRPSALTVNVSDTHETIDNALYTVTCSLVENQFAFLPLPARFKASASERSTDKTVKAPTRIMAPAIAFVDVPLRPTSRASKNCSIQAAP